MVSWSQCVVYGLPGFGFGAVTATRWLMLETACSLFLGWGSLFGVVDVDHRPTSKYSLAIYCNSIQSIQLYRFVFSNPIHPFPSPNLSLKSCPRIPFLPGDDLTIFTVTLRRSAPCAIDLHRSRDFCRANLRCLEWSVVRILFSSSAAWKGGLLGLEVVVDVPRWEWCTTVGDHESELGIKCTHLINAKSVKTSRLHSYVLAVFSNPCFLKISLEKVHVFQHGPTDYETTLVEAQDRLKTSWGRRRCGYV